MNGGSEASGACRREFLVAGALAATAVLTPVLTPGRTSGLAREGQSLDSLVPAQIGSWAQSGLEGVLIPKAEKAEDRAYDDYIARYYTSSTAAPVVLLIAYGSAQTGNTQLHRPEVCYPAAGFKLRKWPDLSLALPNTVPIAARSMTALATGRVEQILYWSRVGREFPTSSAAQRWSTFRQTLEGKVPDGVLVRMSTMNEDRDRALEVLQKFAASLLTAGGTEMRLFLTGRG